MPTFGSKLPQNMMDYLNPIGLVRNLWHHRDLIRQFTRREIEGRYRGSFLGIFWSFITPLVMLCTYTFVFGIGFRARWQGGRTGSLSEYALVLFCGLIAFNLFSDSVVRAPTLIVNVPNYVKKVVFPLEVLPLGLVGSSVFHLVMNLAVLLIGTIFITGGIHWTIILAPLVLAPLLFFSLGSAWLFSGLGVYMRDIGYTVGLGVQVLFFLTPVVYPPEIIREPYRRILYINPLTQAVEDLRRVLIWGRLPEWGNWGVWFLLGAGILFMGYMWFMKTKRGFADVL